MTKAIYQYEAEENKRRKPIIAEPWRKAVKSVGVSIVTQIVFVPTNLAVLETDNIPIPGVFPISFSQITFGYSEDHPKFRLVFILDSVVTEPNLRAFEPFSTAGQTVCPVPIFCANCRTVTSAMLVLLTEQILAIPCDPSSTDGQSSKVRVSQEIRSDPELDAQIRSFDFLSYLGDPRVFTVEDNFLICAQEKAVAIRTRFVTLREDGDKTLHYGTS